MPAVFIGSSRWPSSPGSLPTTSSSRWRTGWRTPPSACPRVETGDAVAFFLYDIPKILLLLSGMIFLISIIRTFFSPERTRALLGGKREGVGNVLAAMLGIVTPFCSCSAVPLFIGFVESGIPAGRDLLVPDRRADHQRGGHRHAVRPVRLEDRRPVYPLRAGDRHHRRIHHRAAEAGALRGGFRLEDPQPGRRRRRKTDLAGALRTRLGFGQGDRQESLAVRDRGDCRRGRHPRLCARRAPWSGSWASRPGGPCRLPC